jgi:hypothetical protein
MVCPNAGSAEVPAAAGRILRRVTDPVIGLPLLVVAGWVVRLPPLSPEEGHEAITRAAWAGLELTEAQQAALMRGVRAPDVSFRGLAVFALPSRQPRHALRAHRATSTDEGVRAMRAFLVGRHRRAVGADEARPWEGFGEVLHCIQDSFSPGHADRDGPRILRMKHWGPFDPREPDEHGFPTDVRDHALVDGVLTDAAREAAAASARYLELARRHLTARPSAAEVDAELAAYLDAWVASPG